MGYILPAPKAYIPTPKVQVINIDWHGRFFHDLQGEEIHPGEMAWLNEPHAAYWIKRGRAKVVTEDTIIRRDTAPSYPY